MTKLSGKKSRKKGFPSNCIDQKSMLLLKFYADYKAKNRF